MCVCVCPPDGFANPLGVFKTLHIRFWDNKKTTFHFRYIQLQEQYDAQRSLQFSVRDDGMENAEQVTYRNLIGVCVFLCVFIRQLALHPFRVSGGARLGIFLAITLRKGVSDLDEANSPVLRDRLILHPFASNAFGAHRRPTNKKAPN